MITSNLWDAHIHFKRTITVPDTSTQDAPTNNRSKNVIFKNCATFTNSISEISNTQIDDAHDIELVIPM